MKKFIIMAIIAIFSVSGIYAQNAKTTDKADKKAKVEVQIDKPANKNKLKKDGTPDKRYKENKHLKKDGTPDKRYKKGNKKKK